MAAPGRAKAGPAANEGETLAFRAPPPPVLYRPPREVVEHAVEAARAEVVRLSCGTFPHLAAKRKCHPLAFRAPPPAGLLIPIFGYGEAADQGDPDSWYAFVLPVDHLDPVALAADRNGGAQAHARRDRDLEPRRVHLVMPRADRSATECVHDHRGVDAHVVSSRRPVLDGEHA